MSLLRSKSVDSPTVEVIRGQWIQLPKPSQLKINKSASQILTAQYLNNSKATSYTSQMQIECSPTRLVLVAVAGWGGEIFSIDYNGITIKTSSLPMPNASIGIQHVLTDFIFTYASNSLLKSLLKSTHIKLSVKNHQRIFSINHKPIITIHYQYTNPWKGKVVLQNLNLHYTISIVNITELNVI